MNVQNWHNSAVCYTLLSPDSTRHSACRERDFLLTKTTVNNSNTGVCPFILYKPAQIFLIGSNCQAANLKTQYKLDLVHDQICRCFFKYNTMTRVANKNVGGLTPGLTIIFNHAVPKALTSGHVCLIQIITQLIQPLSQSFVFSNVIPFPTFNTVQG